MVVCRPFRKGWNDQNKGGSIALVTVPLKVVGKSATTKIKVTGKAFGAALDAVGSDDTPETEEERLVSSQT